MISESSLTWIKSRRCESSSCVEAALVGDRVAIRNSQNPQGPVVMFTLDEWRAFVGGVQDGDFTFDR